VKKMSEVEEAMEEFSNSFEQRFKENLTVTLASETSEELPKDKDIASISIRHTAGTPDAGNYVANTIFRRIYLIVDGEIMVDFQGEYISDVGSLGCLMQRAFVSYQNRYYGGIRNERIDIQFKDAIPAGKTKRLVVEYATTATHVSDGAATTYTGATLSIFYVERNSIPDLWVYQKTKMFEHIVGTATSGQIFLPEVGGNMLLRYLVLAYDDNNALTNTAPTIEVKAGSLVLFRGSWADLQERGKIESGYALPTGIAVLSIPPLQFGSSDFEITYTLAAAPTAGKIHGLMILEGAIAEIES